MRQNVKPTQEPVPSSNIKDLFFNSGLLDIWATSLEHKYIDRFGNCHLTAAGMEWLFKELVETFKVDMNIAIVAAGYITIDSFQQGADLPNNELTQRNQILRDETTGEYYRWDGDLPKQVPAGSTPQSTGGVGKGAWVSVGDASLRSDLGVVVKRYSSVYEMLADTTEVGKEYSTGGTRWRKKMDSSNSIFDFEPLTLIDIEDFGARENEDSSEAIREAVKIGAVRVQAKSYLYDKQKIYTDNVTIIGDKKPVLNDSKNGLTNGSIIIGELNIKGKNPSIINIGVDNGIYRFPSDEDDSNALVFSRSKSLGDSFSMIKDSIGVCRKKESPYHAILCEGHSHVDIGGVVGVGSFYGLAVKSSRMNIDNITCINNDISSVIIKSDGIGDANYVNLSNVNAENSGRSLLRILATDSVRLEMLNVTNFNGNGGVKGIEVSTGGTNQLSVDRCNLSNVNIKNVDIGMEIDGRNLGVGDFKLNNVTLSNCRTQIGIINGYIKSLKINGFYGDIASATGKINEAMVIGSDVRSVMLDNFELLVDRQWPNLATLVLNNGYQSNYLGVVRADLKGVGIPRPGFAELKESGSDLKLTPSFDSSKWLSLFRLVPSEDSVVTSIERVMTSGSRYPHGYKLTIINDSLVNVTIKNSAAGFIQNKNGDLVIPKSSSATYVFGGALWHEV
ncbi:hypothetical protein [Providencia sp. PROV021]|uniref:tail fiber/spike domain-containing protein n=1 Tax=Providencia sp. PROV021 TaxID=2949756 RepID=UPI00234BAAC0|nr:hypothetical protein [Providencia sp. PROV021]